MDGREAAAVIEPIIRRTIERATAPILSRIEALEQRKPEKGDKGDPGDRGTDGTNGTNGRDGTDADPALIQKLIDQGLGQIQDRMDQAVKAIEIPKDGRDGKDADPALIAQMVADAVGNIPHPRDGRDGRDGKDIDPEMVLRIVADSIAQIPRPRDGKDGRDGLSLKNLSFESDGERRITAKFEDGEFVLEQHFDIPSVIDRGVWTEQSYKRGDAVSWGGSLFIAQGDTEATDKPEVSKLWRLAVKRGRDGRHGKDGKDGPPGLQGPRGISFDGQRHP